MLFFSLFFLMGFGEENKGAKASESDKDYSSRVIKYSFTLQNTTNQVLEKAEFWTYAPVKENSTQKVIEIKTSHPYKLITDDTGNQVLYFSFNNFPPYASKIVKIEAKLLLFNKLKIKKSKDLKIYLGPEKYIESGTPEILQLAKELKSSSPVNTAENIFKCISENIKDMGYVAQDRGAFYALKNKIADCTEQAYLFAALCRANKIPARVIGGYICNKDSVLKPNEYHNWAEFYDKGKWLIADSQKKVFIEKQSEYVAMELTGEMNGNPMRGSHRFRFTGEGLKGQMNN